MVIDSSAIIAILEDEPEIDRIAEAIENDPDRFMSAVSLVESAIVIENRHGARGGGELDLLVKKVDIEIISVTPEQAILARQAHREYGKGRHPAKLNFGDCFSYALAKALQQPLLFKGDDFGKTDIICCIQWEP
ncbi:MAG: type II toxin-antitoxin system VapC family toxin [Gammaproteobacteria bacterium]|nr:type II toxin-antitoxin system VapC family toxin [Gammaproteobacteria bacterium]